MKYPPETLNLCPRLFREFFLCNPALGADEVFRHVEQRSTSGRMITDITCQKKDMLLVNYESPDGAKRHNRLWNGGNGVGTVQLFDHHGKLVDRIHAENIGCEYGDYSR